MPCPRSPDDATIVGRGAQPRRAWPLNGFVIAAVARALGLLETRQPAVWVHRGRNSQLTTPVTLVVETACVAIQAIPFPQPVRDFVDTTSWRFATTYAATWPHEYVVRTEQNAPMLLALARHIFAHGVEGRFYAQVRKYHHEGGKVYWSMARRTRSRDADQSMR